MHDETELKPDRARPRSSEFSQWLRGGLAVEPGGGLARRGLAGATRPQSAQSIVEFLLVSVPLLAFLFGILEFGLVFFENTNMEFATREFARTVAICGATCDKYGSDGKLVYRDYYPLKSLEGLSLNYDNIEYVLIQHTGEEKDLPVPGDTNYGRLGSTSRQPDIYDNYKYHWQLYAFPKNSMSATDKRSNTVPARGTNPNSIRLADALPSQIKGSPALATSLPMNPDGSNAKFNGWRSNLCVKPASASDPDNDPNCRKDVPKGDQYGKPVTGEKYDTWPGRCSTVPTDRFYVQIAYRHRWITPFLPTVSADGRSQTLGGFDSDTGILMSNKIYQKVEPVLFRASGNC